ncbi:transglutaminase domain-containing protein [Erysipelothrix sp. HDW6A]|uniref:transglutaminase-like domain-containing protein n=1 Tax=Erysipelothrix sp. HDW6A TaxID=2714928 RepID=UPI0014077A3B|nr:transglutaminase-like domain-containing protein [Erysipelothrix sp. HDW6A]QIK57319.1 transglutaminase domain-containing protein [Erysipelothrix sp. HDW6A]
MIKRFIKFLIISLMFLSVTNPFIHSTTYPSSTNFVFAIVLIVAIASFIDNLILSVVVQIFIYLYLIQTYSNPDQLSLQLWFESYKEFLITTVQAIFSNSTSYIHQDLGFTLLGFVVIPFVNITVRKKNGWKLSAFAIFSFFILLATFNKDMILQPMVQLLLGALLIGLWNTYEDTIQIYWKTVSVGVLCLLLISVSTLNYRSFYQPIYLKLVTSTYGLRSNLSSKGFYETFNPRKAFGIAGRSGFSTDDSTLGGPLYLNYDQVFTVEQTVPTYWRLDNRYTYNGKGWTNSLPGMTELLSSVPDIKDHNAKYSPNKTNYTILSSSESINYLPIPFGSSSVSGISYPVDVNSSRLISMGRDGIETIVFYDREEDLLKGVEYQTYPTITDAEELRKVTNKNTIFRDNRVFDTTKISGKLRILADELTRDETNMYDKVKRIEKYLKEEAGLSYELMNVPYTPDNQDYVEHFLFESKLGYCEQFSSAMVLMLRSLEIPSRWAKGYSSGSRLSANVQEITNADAHTWPEVYFEGYGWVPFEPTPSFSIAEIQSETHQTSNTETPNQETPQTTPNESDAQNELPKPTIPQLQKEEEEASRRMNWFVYFGVLLVLVLAILRNTLYRYILTFVIKTGLLGDSYMKNFNLMMRILTSIIPKEKSETLSEYINSHYLLRSDEMKHLVDKYQRVIYGEDEGLTMEQIDKENMLKVLSTIPWRNKSLSNEMSVVE